MAPKSVSERDSVPQPRDIDTAIPSTPEPKDVVLVPETAIRERPTTPPIPTTRPKPAVPDSAVPNKVPEKISKVMKVKEEPIDSPPKPLPKIDEATPAPVKRPRDEEPSELPFAKRGFDYNSIAQLQE